MIRIALLIALATLGACKDVQPTTATEPYNQVVGDKLIVNLVTNRQVYEGHAEAEKYCYLRHRYVDVRGKFQSTLSDAKCYD